MSADNQTLSVYDKKAQDYAKLTLSDSDDPQLTAFINALPQNAHVLDLGCGPGHACAKMNAAGLRVTATDASGEMVKLAAQHEGVQAFQKQFQDIQEVDTYDGIWANFSLLHAPRNEMPTHLAALRRALKSGGLLHIGMKTGTGAKRDKIGRLYTYYTETEMSDLIRAAGFTPFSSATGTDIGLDGQPANWFTMAAHG